MKIDYINEKLIIYIYDNRLDIDDIDTLNTEIRNIIIKLIKKYNIDFFGYSKVTIYNNEYYGNILEIEKIYQNYRDTIDLKIIIYRNVRMYFEFDDYHFFTKLKNFKIKDNKYYLDINENIDILKYIEFGRIIYD